MCGVGQGPTLAVVDAAGEPGAAGDHVAGPAARRRAASGCCRRWRGWPARSRRPSSGRRGCSRPGTRSGCGCRARRRPRSRGTRRRWTRPTLLAAGRAAVGRAAAARRSGGGWASCGRPPPRRSGLPAGIPVIAGRQRRDGEHARRGPPGRRATPWTPAGRRAGWGSTPTGRSRRTGCSSRRRRCPGAGSWAGRWPRSARRSTGCARTCSAARSTPTTLLAEAAAVPAGRRRAGVPARTSRASGRRCSTRRPAARSSG